ncbi:MAG TPA: amidohydrolase family protein [Candidatus Binatia bacterium]
MPTLIDWHSHHTPSELGDDFVRLTGKAPSPDPYDSPDFDRRRRELDAAGIDVQLVCQGAGLYADRLPADQALAITRRSNDLIAERIAPHGRRFLGVIAVSLKNIRASVDEIERMAAKGFRAVLLYPKTDGAFLLDTPEAEPLFAKIAGLKLPVFLHGATSADDPTLARLEDGGAGVVYGVVADATVNESVLRMIAGGLFDRHPDLKIVIRSGGGGLPLLLQRLSWKHKGADERSYSEILLDHFLIDTAGVGARTLGFLLETMGEERIVFGSDYCGGLGLLKKGVAVIEQQPDPARIKAITERTSRNLLGL